MKSDDEIYKKITEMMPVIEKELEKFLDEKVKFCVGVVPDSRSKMYMVSSIKPDVMINALIEQLSTVYNIFMNDLKFHGVEVKKH